MEERRALYWNEELMGKVERNGEVVNIRLQDGSMISAEQFLEKFRPSTHAKADRVHIRNDNIPNSSYDLAAIKSEWESAKFKDEPTLLTIANKHGYKSGKWFFYPKDNELDMFWDIVVKSITEGELRTVAMEAYALLVKEGEGLICIYNEDYSNVHQMDAVEKFLRKSGFKRDLKYKLNLYTALDIYPRSYSTLRATTFQTQLNLENRMSIIALVQPACSAAQDNNSVNMTTDPPVIYTNELQDILSVEEWLERYPLRRTLAELGTYGIEIRNNVINKGHEDDFDSPQYPNLLSMQVRWKSLVSLDVPINGQLISAIADNYDVKGGKWEMKFHSTTGQMVEDYWKTLVKELCHGELGTVAMGLSAIQIRHSWQYVIAVHNSNYTDREIVNRIKNILHQIGIKYFDYKKHVHYHLSLIKGTVNNESTCEADFESHIAGKYCIEDTKVLRIGNQESNDDADKFFECIKPSQSMKSVWLVNDRLMPTNRVDFHAVNRHWLDTTSNAEEIPIDVWTLRNIAKTYNFKWGYWFFFPKDQMIDHACKLITECMANGDLATIVMAAKFKPCSDGSYMICVYNQDYEDRKSVDLVETVLRSRGIHDKLLYKLDIYQQLQIPVRNRFGLKIESSSWHCSSNERRWKLAPQIRDYTFHRGEDEPYLVDDWRMENPPSTFTTLSPGICRINLHDPDEELTLKRMHKWRSIAKHMANNQICDRTVRNLSLQFELKLGRWIFYIDYGLQVDIYWKYVVNALIDGDLGNVVIRAEIMSCDYQDKHAVKIYNKDYTDRAEVYLVEELLRKTGIKCEMKYEPVIYSNLGIYLKNSYDLSPIIYKSSYDVLSHESNVQILRDLDNEI